MVYRGVILKQLILLFMFVVIQGCAEGLPSNMYDTPSTESSSVLAPASTPDPQPQPTVVVPTPPPLAESVVTVPIYRFAYWYGTASTTSATEAASTTPFYSLFQVSYSHRKALYRCLSAGFDSFTSTSANCEGQTVIGLLGYAETAAAAHAPRALYRCFTGFGHLDVVNPGECTAYGGTVESVLGYVQ